MGSHVTSLRFKYRIIIKNTTDRLVFSDANLRESNTANITLGFNTRGADSNLQYWAPLLRQMPKNSLGSHYA